MAELARRSASYVVIGAGVHGLSTAWHLAQAGHDVLVLDKTGVAAGASGIACGVIRNNYFQPAMAELMAECVAIWESDPEAFNYHGSGYIALGPPEQESDLTTVRERHEAIGYDSELILGEAEVARHMRGLFSDWRAEGLTVCLHEHRGGFAFNTPSMEALARKAHEAGARIETGVDRHRLRPRRVRLGDRRAYRPRATSRSRAGRDRRRPVGRRAVGDARPARPPRRPHARRRGARRPADVDLLVPPGGRGRRRPAHLRTDDGALPPVLHVDSDAAARRRRRRARSPPSRGASTSSATATRSRAAPRRCRWATTRGRPVPDRQRRADVRRRVLRRAVPLPRALRGRPRALP